MNEIGENLKRIRLLKNLSLNDVGKLMNMSTTAISKYEKGQIIPDSKKLIEFANAYQVKAIEFLKKYQPIQMKFTSFRKRKRLKGKNLDLLKSLIQKEVSNYLEVISINNYNENSIHLKPYKCNAIEDAENVAIKFREKINYSLIQPLSDLINTLENLGILIIQIQNPDERFNDFDGLSEYVNGIPIIVLLDGIQDGARQRFTIAHELGHLLLNISNDLDEEKLCNRFASSLLMPKEAVIREFGSYRNNISFYELIAFKYEYKVSIATIIYRLKDLNIISQYTYKNLSIYLNKNYVKKKEPVLLAPESTYQFKKMIYKLENSQIISLNKACELLGVTAYEYNRENNNY